MNPIFQALTALAISIISPTVLILIVSKIFKLGELNEKFNGVLKNMEVLQTKVAGLSKDMIILKTFLIKDGGLDISLFNSSSPLKLMEKGEKILKESNFDKILENNKDFFMKKLEEFPISSEAEIDEASTQLLENLKEDPLLKGFKDVAYNHGIIVEVLLKVCAIYLREQAIVHFLKKTKPQE